MKKGLGMWILSKTVILIFLFSLVMIMTIFLKIYSDKVVSDTARSYTTYWSEVASSALSFESSSDSVYLEPVIRVRESQKQYTAFVVKSKGRENRITFLLSWARFDQDKDYKDYKTEYSMKYLESFEQKHGYAAASALNMPEAIEDIYFFNVVPGSDPQDPEYDVIRNDEQPLIAQPSNNLERETDFIFYRNETVFCVATLAAGQNITAAIRKVGRCCYLGVEGCD